MDYKFHFDLDRKKDRRPSRDDAVRLRRSEKRSMMFLIGMCNTMDEFLRDLHDRLGMIENGEERMRKLLDDCCTLMEEVRMTIPLEQRLGIENTANDYKMALCPKVQSFSDNNIVSEDELKALVDASRTLCRECVNDDKECEKCDLFRLLSCVLPMENYHYSELCPYNLAEWRG